MLRPSQVMPRGPGWACRNMYIGSIIRLFSKNLAGHRISPHGPPPEFLAGHPRDRPLTVRITADFSRFPLCPLPHAIAIPVALFRSASLPVRRQLNPLGGARDPGNRTATLCGAFPSTCARIFGITAGSSMLAMTFNAPPHSVPVSMSILNTRFRRPFQRPTFGAPRSPRSGAPWQFSCRRWSEHSSE